MRLHWWLQRTQTTDIGALYKKHAEFRELEDPLQDEQPQANESVSFELKI